LKPFQWIRWKDGKHRTFALLQIMSELVLLTWIMLIATVGNSGYEMKI
jgi:hypothetical protein